MRLYRTAATIALIHPLFGMLSGVISHCSPKPSQFPQELQDIAYVWFCMFLGSYNILHQISQSTKSDHYKLLLRSTIRTSLANAPLKHTVCTSFSPSFLHSIISNPRGRASKGARARAASISSLRRSSSDVFWPRAFSVIYLVPPSLSYPT